MSKRIQWKKLSLLILGTLFIIGFVRQEFAIKRIKEDISHKREQLQNVQEENKALQDKIKNVDSDEYIETLARERLDMVKPGEEIVKNKKR